MNKKFLKPPVHTLIAAITPAVSLFAINLGIVHISALLRPLFFALLLGLLVYALLFIIYRSSQKAGISTTVVLLGFYYAAPLSQKIFQSLGNSQITKILLIIIVVEIMATLFWLLARNKLPLKDSTHVINIMILSMLLVPLFNTIAFGIRGISNANELDQSGHFSSIEPPPSVDSSKKPDIYYIILDSYGRSDRISELLNYDNSSFLDKMRDMGFYVADCSNANYLNTIYSIATTLNLDYMDSLSVGNDNAELQDQTVQLIQNNRVMHFLKETGYEIVTFETLYPYLNFTDGVYYETQRGSFFSLTDFERIFIDSTLLKFLIEDLYALNVLFSMPILQNDFVRIFGYDFDTDQQILENLEKSSAEIQSPKFVYAHIMAPHPPFVFTPDGEYTDSGYRFGLDIKGDFYISGYTDELTYLEKVIPRIMGQIIENSETQPIIVIQGDHGFDSFGDPPVIDNVGVDDRAPILNMYYLPGVQTSDYVYDTLSPVNTFRLIFAHYFVLDLELLPDQTYSRDDGMSGGFSLENPSEICTK